MHSAFQRSGERPIVAILYARPSGELRERIETIYGVAVRALDVDAGALTSPFETTLEEALAAIERRPRGFAEPDGSFTLHERESRIDGELYDRPAEQGDRVSHADVRGPRAPTLWRCVFDALVPRGPAGIVVHLSEEGVTLSGDDFLELLSR